MPVLPTFLGGGVIDSDYKGNIAIILRNFAACDVDIRIDNRIAQIIFLRPEEFLLKKLLSLQIGL